MDDDIKAQAAFEELISAKMEGRKRKETEEAKNAASGAFQNIDPRIAKANELYEEGKGGLIAATRAHIKAGELLIEIKRSLRHGQWGPYLREHRQLFKFSARTAQNLMKMARDAADNPDWDKSLASATAFNRRHWGHDKEPLPPEQYLNLRLSPDYPRDGKTVRDLLEIINEMRAQDPEGKLVEVDVTDLAPLDESDESGD